MGVFRNRRGTRFAAYAQGYVNSFLQPSHGVYWWLRTGDIILYQLVSNRTTPYGPTIYLDDGLFGDVVTHANGSTTTSDITAAAGAPRTISVRSQLTFAHARNVLGYEFVSDATSNTTASTRYLWSHTNNPSIGSMTTTTTFNDLSPGDTTTPSGPPEISSQTFTSSTCAAGGTGGGTVYMVGVVDLGLAQTLQTYDFSLGTGFTFPPPAPVCPSVIDPVQATASGAYVLEYSSDGTTWTPASVSGSAPPNGVGGGFNNYRIQGSFTGTHTGRYIRATVTTTISVTGYGSWVISARARITDFRISATGGAGSTAVGTFLLRSSTDGTNFTTVASGSIPTQIGHLPVQTMGALSLTGILAMELTVSLASVDNVTSLSLDLYDTRYLTPPTPVLTGDFCSSAGNLVGLSWTSDAVNVEGWRIYRDGVAYLTFFKPDLSSVILEQVGGEEHSWQVFAFVGSVESNGSNVVTGTPNAPPNATLTVTTSQCGRFHTLNYGASGYGDTVTLTHYGSNDEAGNPIYTPDQTDILVSETTDNPTGTITYTLRAHEVPMPQTYTLVVANTCGTETLTAQAGPEFLSFSCAGTIYDGPPASDSPDVVTHPLLDLLTELGIRVLFIHDGLLCAGEMVADGATLTYAGPSGASTFEMFGRTWIQPNPADYAIGAIYGGTVAQRAARYYVPCTQPINFTPATDGFTFIRFPLGQYFGANGPNTRTYEAVAINNLDLTANTVSWPQHYMLHGQQTDASPGYFERCYTNGAAGGVITNDIEVMFAADNGFWPTVQTVGPIQWAFGTVFNGSNYRTFWQHNNGTVSFNMPVSGTAYSGPFPATPAIHVFLGGLQGISAPHGTSAAAMQSVEIWMVGDQSNNVQTIVDAVRSGMSIAPVIVPGQICVYLNPATEATVYETEQGDCVVYLGAPKPTNTWN